MKLTVWTLAFLITATSSAYDNELAPGSVADEGKISALHKEVINWAMQQADSPVAAVNADVFASNRVDFLRVFNAKAAELKLPLVDVQAEVIVTGFSFSETKLFSGVEVRGKKIRYCLPCEIPTGFQWGALPQ